MSAHDMLVGLDGGVGPERRAAVLDSIRADLRERGADSDSLAQAVALVLQNLRDAFNNAGDLLFRVELDQFLQSSRVAPPPLLQSRHVHVRLYPITEVTEEVHPFEV